MIRLLFHSDDGNLAKVLGPTLGPEFRVEVEADRGRIKEIATDNQCDILILDFKTKPCGFAQQLELVDEYRESGIPVVVMTDDSRRSTAMELLQRGAYDYFRKPPSIQELKIICRRAHEHASVKRELEALKGRGGPVVARREEAEGCDRLIGRSARARAVYSLIERVTNVNSFVLITGESGTGKELIARAIHNLSDRAKQPFVALSCGAVPETLIEAELFGCEKGAFTGATGTRMGYLEQAGAGTLLLDEIGEISLHTQVKLLRVLQEREFTRLGSSRPIPLRARVLFSTHRDLGQMVTAGTFRQDLYYRLNVMKIDAPALRERAEDIPLLAEHFLTIYGEMYGKPGRTLRPEAMAALLEHNWPGNIRELENVMQSALLMADGESIGLDELPEAFQPVDPVYFDDAAGGGSFEEQLREYRLKLAMTAVAEAKGNKTLAARSLHISRAYLHRLIREGGDEVDVL